MDAGNESIASKCFNSLKNKFGDKSARVQRLLGMQLESKRNYGEAKKIYESILKENPSNQLVKKRLVSVHMANGKIKEAIKLLVKHISMCATDAMAWQQLANLYISVNCYRHASFCYEELITINPRESLYHLMYAELKYTTGREEIEDLILARRYFAMAVDVKPSKRALIGMAMSAKSIMKDKTNNLKKEEIELNQKIHRFATEKLNSMYKGTAAPEVDSYMMTVLNKV